jgi:transcriptional antiterminator RfaH
LVDRVDSLFPNYLFLHANPMTDNLARVRSTRGVRNLVRFGLEPAEVPPEVIDELQARSDKQSGVIKLTGQTRQEVAAKFSEGAFVDFGGVFLTSDGSERVILLMRVLGDYNKVNLPEEQLDGRQVAA